MPQLMIIYLVEIKKSNKHILMAMLDYLMDKIINHPHKFNLNIKLILEDLGVVLGEALVEVWIFKILEEVNLKKEIN